MGGDYPIGVLVDSGGKGSLSGEDVNVLAGFLMGRGRVDRGGSDCYRVYDCRGESRAREVVVFIE